MRILGLPIIVWFNNAQRLAHIRRVKHSVDKERGHQAAAIGKLAPELTTSMVFPHDMRTLENDFPGLRNLGNTCYLNAVLQCMFHCEPLGADLFNTPDMTGIIERTVRAVFAEYIASDESTVDVIAPIAVVNELRRHVGFTLSRQQDAAECLRHLLQYTGLGHRHCDAHADMVDGSVVLSYTPEAAQVSVAAAAIDARALLLEATTGDGGLKHAPAALVIRINNIYEQGIDEFWVDARVEWPKEALTVTIDNHAAPQAQYVVQSYLTHRREEGVSVSRGMRSGHYVAYFQHDGSWYLADDAKVTLLTEAPQEFPYIVFLTRSNCLGDNHMGAMRKRIQNMKRFRKRAVVMLSYIVEQEARVGMVVHRTVRTIAIAT